MLVMLPSRSSLAVAPGSVKALPCTIDMLALPLSVMTGLTVSALVPPLVPVAQTAAPVDVRMTKLPSVCMTTLTALEPDVAVFQTEEPDFVYKTKLPSPCMVKRLPLVPLLPDAHNAVPPELRSTRLPSLCILKEYFPSLDVSFWLTYRLWLADRVSAANADKGNIPSHAIDKGVKTRKTLFIFLLPPWFWATRKKQNLHRQVFFSSQSRFFKHYKTHRPIPIKPPDWNELSLMLVCNKFLRMNFLMISPA